MMSYVNGDGNSLWTLLGLKGTGAAGRSSPAPTEWAALAAYRHDQGVILRQFGTPPSRARSAVGGGHGSDGGCSPKGGATGKSIGGREEQDDGNLRTLLGRLKRDVTEVRKKAAGVRRTAGGAGKDKEPLRN